MKTVRIFGFGPVGLTAAWAALSAGWTVEIVSDKQLAKPTAASAGVYVFHDPMNLPLRSAEMAVRSFGGSAEDYAAKVYGNKSADVSFSRYPDAVEVWDAQQGIDMMYDIVASASPGHIQMIVTGQTLGAFIANDGNVPHFTGQQQPDAFISTLPYTIFDPAACYSADAWVHQGAAPADECYMLYNANRQMGWYRASAAFGRFTMEYAAVASGDVRRCRRITKVASRFGPFPQLPENWMVTGRLARWEKDYLTHHTYDDTIAFLEKLS